MPVKKSSETKKDAVLPFSFCEQEVSNEQILASWKAIEKKIEELEAKSPEEGISGTSG